MGATDLLKKMGKVVKEIVVAWVNFGKEAPPKADVEEDGSEEGYIPPELAEVGTIGTLKSLEPKEELIMEESFEDHVISLFNQSEFEVMGENENGMVSADSPMPLDVKDLRPDLLMRHKPTGIKFGVILKFYRKLTPNNNLGLLKVLEGYQRKRLQMYSQRFRLPCFVMLGAGTAEIDRLSLIPLEKIPPGGMEVQEVAKYDRDIERPVTFMELADRSALYNELALEKADNAILKP